MSITVTETSRKGKFVIKQSEPEKLKMYICGPTVYTDTHIGHLKTYLTFDIIRRILGEYFRIPVQYMMNITNVDDKIIKGTYQKKYGDMVDINELKKSDYLSNQEFVEYADHWENDFFEVMDMMGIQRPDIVSRVTDYIDEIHQFVASIEANGFTFVNDGSVYFYGTKYHDIKDPDSSEYLKDPDNKYNFVLLKRSKPHEPSWESDWGRVRPGWHIECSAMTSSVFGKKLDIHAGGIDLKFPHHHNETVQSNARFYPDARNQSLGLNPETNNVESKGDCTECGDTTWVDNFMHSGHLNIKGLKMSRSLKNFITAREILKSYTQNQIRMLFLLHKWHATMDYGDETMEGAIYYDTFFTNFFKQIKSASMRKTANPFKKTDESDTLQRDRLDELMITVDKSLRDDSDTTSVIGSIQGYVNQLYVYIIKSEKTGDVSKQILDNSVNYISGILGIFGLRYHGTDGTNDSKSDDMLQIISDVRENLRVIAKDISLKVKGLSKELARELPKDIYRLTDEIRDVALPKIGIHLTDR